MKHNYLIDCAKCGRTFSAKTPRAKTCSDACRVALSRATRKNGGTSLHDLTDIERVNLQQILTLSEPAYNRLFSLLTTRGAYIFRDALSAVLMTWEALINVIEAQR